MGGALGTIFQHIVQIGFILQNSLVFLLNGMKYRDNRNNTAHDYGRAFAEETLALVDDFLQDVKNLKAVIENG